MHHDRALEGNQLLLKDTERKNSSAPGIGKAVGVFVRGTFSGEGVPVLLNKQTYIVFLSRLDPQTFAHAQINAQSNNSCATIALRGGTVYTVTRDKAGLVSLKGKDRKFLKRMERSIAKK